MAAVEQSPLVRNTIIIVTTICLLGCQTLTAPSGGEFTEEQSDGVTTGQVVAGLVLLPLLIAGLILLGNSEHDKCEKYRDRYYDCLDNRDYRSCRDERNDFEERCY
jgi:hypothetical protein